MDKNAKDIALELLPFVSNLEENDAKEFAKLYITAVNNAAGEKIIKIMDVFSELAKIDFRFKLYYD